MLTPDKFINFADTYFTLSNNRAKKGLIPVPSMYFSLISDKVIPYIEKAIKTVNSKETVQSLVATILSNENQLWVFLDSNKICGQLITCFKKINDKKILLVRFIATESFFFKEIKICFETTLVQIAKDNACNYIEFYGRKGWDKWSAPLGYKPSSIVYTKELIYE